MMYFSEVVKLLSGRPYNLSRQAVIKGISTDSRTIKEGELFFALKGKVHDGHDFVLEAAGKGAVASVVSRPLQNTVPFIVVKDTITALSRLAQIYRMQLPAKVIAITGTNGKTTTKEMVAHILSFDKNVVKAPSSYNNQIGLPLTIFKANEETRYLVVEVGASKRHEIARLAQIAYPDVACITNISEAHLEGFKSIKNIAKEKCKIARFLRAGGKFVVNQDIPIIKKYLNLNQDKILTFSLYSSSENADFYPEEIKDQNGSISFKVRGCWVRLDMFGVWNIYNALASIAICSLFGIDVDECARRLSTFTPVNMRMQPCKSNGLTVINDAYNANPVSMRLALLELDKLPCNGKKIAVLGDMLELGSKSSRYHRETGELINKLSIDIIVAVGEQVRSLASSINSNKQVTCFNETDDACVFLKKIATDGSMILLKGSRAMHLEKIAEGWAT